MAIMMLIKIIILVGLVSAETRSLPSGQSIVQFMLRDNMKVVIKRAFNQDDFDREFQILTRLKHCPGILQPIFVIPELRELGFKQIEGGDLYRQSNLVNVTLDQGREWARQLIQTVQCVHDAGFLHLDIKPENVLLDGSRIWLIDFGLACPISEPIRGIGTTRTMAPEMLLEEAAHLPITTATDWWSMGVTLFYLISRLLFPGQGTNFPYEVTGNPPQIHWQTVCPPFPSSFYTLLFGSSGLLSLDYRNRPTNAKTILTLEFFQPPSQE